MGDLRAAPDAVSKPKCEHLAGGSTNGNMTHALPMGSTKPGTRALCGVLANPIGDGTLFLAIDTWRCLRCDAKCEAECAAPDAGREGP